MSFTTFEQYRNRVSATGGTMTKDTRSELTALTDSKVDPASRANYPKKREAIYEDLFEIRTRHTSLFEQLYYDASLSDAAKLFTIIKTTMRPGNRWTSMPQFPLNEKQVQTAFMKIVQELKMHWRLHLDQEKIYPFGSQNNVIDTSQKNIETRDGGFLKPDIFFEGTGRLFPVLQKEHPGDPPSWSLCLVPADIKTTKDSNMKKIFSQLGTYAEQVFAAQENRRFVPTFRLDESIFLFFIFDRGGVVQGRSMDYHTDPSKLCALVQKLVFQDDADLGLDPSIYYQGGSKYIRTGDIDGFPTLSVVYTVVKTLFHSTDIRGSGSIYWLVRRNGDEDENTRYLIKDSWVVGGCTLEQELLESRKDLKGVASLVHIEDVKFGGRVDSVSNNRPEGATTLAVDDRIHTRAVFHASLSAKLLNQFSSTLELLTAFQDAVLGHRQLHESGVLHGNITPTRILIQPEASRGSRGVLLDLEWSMEIASPTIRLTGMPGSRAFWSRNTLHGGNASYFDDLESFFYVLCYLVAHYPASGSAKPEVARYPFAKWFTGGGRPEKVTGIFDLPCPFYIHKSYANPVKDLVKNLHGFFRDRTIIFHQSNAIPKPEEGYNKFLEHLSVAIDALGGDEWAQGSSPQVVREESSAREGRQFTLFEAESLRKRVVSADHGESRTFENLQHDTAGGAPGTLDHGEYILDDLYETIKGEAGGLLSRYETESYREAYEANIQTPHEDTFLIHDGTASIGLVSPATAENLPPSFEPGRLASQASEHLSGPMVGGDNQNPGQPQIVENVAYHSSGIRPNWYGMHMEYPFFDPLMIASWDSLPTPAHTSSHFVQDTSHRLATRPSQSVLYTDPLAGSDSSQYFPREHRVFVEHVFPQLSTAHSLPNESFPQDLHPGHRRTAERDAGESNQSVSLGSIPNIYPVAPMPSDSHLHDPHWNVTHPLRHNYPCYGDSRQMHAIKADTDDNHTSDSKTGNHAKKRQKRPDSPAPEPALKRSRSDTSLTK